MLQVTDNNFEVLYIVKPLICHMFCGGYWTVKQYGLWKDNA